MQDRSDILTFGAGKISRGNGLCFIRPHCLSEYRKPVTPFRFGKSPCITACLHHIRRIANELRSRSFRLWGFSPNHFGFSLRHFGFSPNYFGFSPNYFGFSPNYFGFSPSHFGFSPNHFGFSPSHFGFSPNYFGFSPSHFGFSPNYFGFSPSHFGFSAETPDCIALKKQIKPIYQSFINHSLSTVIISWVKNLFANVVAFAVKWNLNPTSWVHIDPPMITAYEQALAKAQDPNSGVADTLEKNETRDTLKTATRKYVPRR